MKTLVVLWFVLVSAVFASGNAAPNVFCADEPGARTFLESMPDQFTASELTNSDNLYEKWLETLSAKTRLPIRESDVTNNKYVVSTAAPQPIVGWDGSPVQCAAVIAVNGDGDPITVIVIAASDRAVAKACCANYLRWKFKGTLGQLELRPGIYKSVPSIAFFYARQTFATDPDKTTAHPPPMQVFAKIIN